MKRLIAVLLMLTMAVSAAFAEEIPGGAEKAQAVAPAASVQYDYDELVVGNVMPMYGAFSLANWGNSTSDIDVRKLIHGYNLVEWDTDVSGFRLNPSVVADGSIVSQDADGNHVYNMTLYDDLQYSDGTKITAWDYAFSWLLRTSQIIEELGGKRLQAEFLTGWKEYAAGETPRLAGVRVTGTYHLQIRISADYLPFFYEAGLLDCYPYPISEIAPGCEVADDGRGVYIRNKESGDGEALFTADLLRETLLDETKGYLSHPGVVSGAYRLLSYDGTEARFELNPYFKGDSEGMKPMIQRIIFRVANADTMISELMEGKYGLLNKVSRADAVQEGIMQAVGSGSYSMATYPRQGLSFVTFNGTRPATADPAVRKAIALCMDKANLLHEYVGDFGARVDNFYGIGQWMYQIATGTLALEPEEGMTEAEQEQMQKDWEAISLEGLETYEFDIARANQMLDEAGWTLNKNGEAYENGRDEVRCKEIDGTLVPLELKLVYPETTKIGEAFEQCFAAHLKEAGIALEIAPSADVLAMYYGQAEADYDMMFLGTNFETMFDPTHLFTEETNVNVAGVKSEELVAAAQDMRKTESGDLLTYCTKWLVFLEKFAEVEPMIPVYSNVYYDCHPTVLRNYSITESVTWSEAAIGSDFSDVPEEAEEPAEAAEGENIESTAGE